MATAETRKPTYPEGWLGTLNARIRGVDLPFTLRFYGVTEELFDELVDEDTRADLLDGVMIVHSPASPAHDDLAGFLRALMRGYAGSKKQGIVLGPDSVIHLRTCRKVAPDIYFLKQAKVPRPLPEKEFEIAPDLVVEVLSPSNRREDIAAKRPAYEAAGVGEIWLVDTEKLQVVVDVRRRKRYATQTITEGRVTATALPGFWVETSWLWSDPKPDMLACLLEILK